MSFFSRHRALGFVLLLCWASVVDAADHYVTETGAGSADGSTWSNACNKFSGACAVASLVRGDTYYQADGAYGTVIFATATSGSLIITIRKATVTSHGTGTGWSDTMGDGAATWTSVTFSTSYWVFDGSLGGGPGSWKTGHGFTFNNAACTDATFIDTVDGVSSITLRHIGFTQTGNTEACGDSTSAIYTATGGEGVISNSRFEYLYFDNLGGLPFFMRGGSGNIIQYNYTGNICGKSVFDVDLHCEAIVVSTMSDLHFRWNYIGESPSSGGVVKNSVDDAADVRIYGNIIRNGVPIQCNSGPCSGWRIFNNTFTGVTSGPVSGSGTYTSALMYNNLTVVASFIQAFLSGLTHGYNWFSQIASNSCSMGEVATENIINTGCDVVTEIADPFVDITGTTPDSLVLTGPIIGWPGTNLCDLDPCTGENRYTVDIFGRTRGSDGVWERGAVEYGGGPVRLRITP